MKYGLLALSIFFSMEAAERIIDPVQVRTEPPYKMSFIVPCYHGHAKHLYSLLRLLENQTVLPDEVVISLSEFDKVSQEVYDALIAELWSFPILLVATTKKLYAGQNRNVACSHASGDVFICQDADDVPYPRRVEIIKYFFERYNPLHLMHQYIFSAENGQVAFEGEQPKELVQYHRPRRFSDVFKHGAYTNGNVAIHKSLFSKIKWSDDRRGQDTKFNARVYRQFRNRIIIATPLLVYRQFLSSVKDDGMPVAYELPTDIFPDFQTAHPELKQYEMQFLITD